MLNRRQIFAAGAALPFGLRALASTQTHTTGAEPKWLLLGTDKGQGIYRARWNGRTGALGTPELAASSARPDFLALHPDLPVLYAGNAVSAPGAGLSVFGVERTTGTLTFKNFLPTQGDGPCFNSVDPTGKLAFVANYTGGSLSTFALNPDGSLARRIGLFQARQVAPGPNAERQDAAHLHSASLAPGGRSVLVCDLGGDAILVFPIDPAQAHIGQPLRAAARPGSGPRHVASHPNGRWLYCIHELDCTVDLYDWQPGNTRAPLTLRPGSKVSTLSAPAHGAGSTAAEIAASDDGRFVYTCTRSENSLTIFRVNPHDGTLAVQQQVPCGGEIPRYLALDPSRRWLLCCNQGDSTVSVFAHDPATGRLDPAPRIFKADTPMFCLWI